MIRRKATVWTASTYDGYPLVFVWNGSVTVNVFTGLQAESQHNSDLFLEDVVESDVFTLYGENGTLPTADEVEAAITEYLNYPDEDA